MFKKILLAVIVLIGVVCGLFFFNHGEENNILSVQNFEECVLAGNPVMESFPRQCAHNGQTFVENIGNTLEKRNFIQLDQSLINQPIKSPLKLTGKARGSWFFEGDFPVYLTNWDGLIIAESYASAKGDSLTDEFVLFEVTLEFEENQLYNRGTLILQKDNPLGLPENDDALEIPIIFD